VVSSFFTAGNYDYGLFWYFYQDGSIQFEAKLTGIVYSGGVPESGPPPWGTMVAEGVYAPVHQHFFAMRLDFDLDGGPSTVVEVDSVTDDPGPDNRYANAFRPVYRYFDTEDEVARDTNAAAGRYWMVVNEESINGLGQHVGYRLIPGEASRPLPGRGSDFDQRAGFLRHNLYATAYSPEQRYASGEYPNQATAEDGVLAYQRAGRSIRRADVVTWYTFGHHHVPRPEDWPVMPVHHMGFSLKPSGFFDRNPALDVAPSGARCHTGPC
jgi:primary-amine oxidase